MEVGRSAGAEELDSEAAALEPPFPEAAAPLTALLPWDDVEEGEDEPWLADVELDVVEPVDAFAVEAVLVLLGVDLVELVEELDDVPLVDLDAVADPLDVELLEVEAPEEEFPEAALACCVA